MTILFICLALEFINKFEGPPIKILIKLCIARLFSNPTIQSFSKKSCIAGLENNPAIQLHIYYNLVITFISKDNYQALNLKNSIFFKFF